ncbi:MAG: prolipoprotein diacylglyceryl transferase family protein [Pirellulales bacterium]
MRQTLFAIPREIAGVDVFGMGWLLAIWAVASLVVLAWMLHRHGWSAETRSQLFTLGLVGFAIAFVLPMLVTPEGLLIRGYGVMLMTAVLAGVGLSMVRARQKGVSPEIILSLAMWLFISGLLGARLFYVVEYWDLFQKPTLRETIIGIVNLTQGGLVVFGSMLAGGAALVVFIYKYRVPGLALADLIAPGVVLGTAIGRVGCLLNGCCYGSETDLPWAVAFPEGTPAYIDQAQRGELYIHGLKFAGSGSNTPVIEAVAPQSPAARAGLAAGQVVTVVNDTPVHSVEEAQFAMLGIFGDGQQLSLRVAGTPSPHVWTIEGSLDRGRPMHPTQLYSFIDGMLLCFFLLAYEPYRRRDGELTAWVLTIHPVMRFLVEFVRVDESPVFHTGLSISQNISIALFVSGIALWIYLLRQPLGCRWPAHCRLEAVG